MPSLQQPGCGILAAIDNLLAVHDGPEPACSANVEPSNAFRAGMVDLEHACFARFAWFGRGGRILAGLPMAFTCPKDEYAVCI